MSEETERLRKRIRVETTVIRMSTLAGLLFSAWTLFHFVTQALSGLARFVPWMPEKKHDECHPRVC